MVELGAEKGRADFLGGLWAFLNGVACAVAIWRRHIQKLPIVLHRISKMQEIGFGNV